MWIYANQTLTDASRPTKLMGVQSALAIPRVIESSHLLIMGDSSTGKSARIRQLLGQLEDRADGRLHGSENWNNARQLEPDSGLAAANRRASTRRVSRRG